MKNQTVVNTKPSTLIIAAAVVTFLLLLIFTFGRTEGDGQTHPTIPVYTYDVAPEAGVAMLFVQYGTGNRPEGTMVGQWQLAAGERLNAQASAPAPNHARLWFRSTATGQMYLMPSQYWNTDEIAQLGVATCRNEYGVSQRESLPSYHTGFGRKISQSQVPLLQSDGRCGAGSAAINPQPTATIPAPTPVPTPVPMPTPTLCIQVSRSIDSASPCGS